MEKVYVGKIVNTHGIKGELKVKSDFKYKDDIFVKDVIIYIDDIAEKIISSRNHKDYKLVLFEGYDNINQVLKYKGKSVYIDRSIINSDYILNEDIIGFDVYVGDKCIGKLDDIIKNNAHEILKIGTVMIPYVKAFVYKIDLDGKKIFVNDIEGLL